jgi:hypothetical protein
VPVATITSSGGNPVIGAATVAAGPIADTATTGNLTLSASSINATVAIPEASGATTNTQGVVKCDGDGRRAVVSR